MEIKNNHFIDLYNAAKEYYTEQKNASGTSKNGALGVFFKSLRSVCSQKIYNLLNKGTTEKFEKILSCISDVQFNNLTHTNRTSAKSSQAEFEAMREKFATPRQKMEKFERDYANWCDVHNEQIQPLRDHFKASFESFLKDSNTKIPLQENFGYKFNLSLPEACEFLHIDLSANDNHLNVSEFVSIAKQEADRMGSILLDGLEKSSFSNNINDDPVIVKSNKKFDLQQKIDYLNQKIEAAGKLLETIGNIPSVPEPKPPKF